MARGRISKWCACLSSHRGIGLSGISLDENYWIGFIHNCVKLQENKTRQEVITSIVDVLLNKQHGTGRWCMKIKEPTKVRCLKSSWDNVHWMKAVWECIPSELGVKSFKNCGSSNAIDKLQKWIAFWETFLAR